jgi:hypothetical protein
VVSFTQRPLCHTGKSSFYTLDRLDDYLLNINAYPNSGIQKTPLPQNISSKAIKTFNLVDCSLFCLESARLQSNFFKTGDFEIFHDSANYQH